MRSKTKTDGCASDQIVNEIGSVMRRYAHESDVTVYQLIGALEIVKSDLIEMLDKPNKRKPSK